MTSDPGRPGQPPEPEGAMPEPLSPDDERMNAWLDKALGPAQAKDFESELAADPAKEKQAKTLAQVLATLRELPKEEAPKDLLRDVQTDIRQKSRGRYYGYHWKYRFPYEALLNSLLLIVAVVIYVMARPAPPKLIPVEAKSFLVSGSDLGVGARILSDYGTFQRDLSAPNDGVWLYLTGEVAADRMEAFRSELSLYPSMRLDGEVLAGAVFKVQVAVKR